MASYRQAVRWIAENDEGAETQAWKMSTMISVVLVADLFNKEPMKVAEAVIRLRKKEA